MALSSETKQRPQPELLLALEIGRQIRLERIARGMSQADLGRPFTRAYVSQVESGRTLPSLPALFHLADRLGVDPCNLLPSRPGDQRRYTPAHGDTHTLHRASSR
jgi:transcriptional regulator with XRE-family HTH domain